MSEAQRRRAGVPAHRLRRRRRGSDENGMSVRTYIATEAMAALIVANSRRDGPAMDADAITDAAVLYADGLIEALK